MDTQTVLTDIQNRRRDLSLVANRAGRHNYPLLLWPNDEELIRLDDVPLIEAQPNIPSTWKECRELFSFVVTSTSQLRKHLRALNLHVKGYAITGKATKLFQVDNPLLPVYTEISVYSVKSR